jgi:hypothetical protein
LVVEAPDLAVVQAVVAEGEDVAGDRDLGDAAAAAFGDPFVLGSERPAAGGDRLRGFGQCSTQDRGALVGARWSISLMVVLISRSRSQIRVMRLSSRRRGPWAELGQSNA